MDQYNREPIKLKPRIIMHPAGQPVALRPPTSQPVTASLEDLVKSGHIKGVTTMHERGQLRMLAWIDNNPELLFEGWGATAEEALANLKARILEAGLDNTP